MIDVRMKEGNNKESKRKATVGLVSSKVMFEGPLKKDKVLIWLLQGCLSGSDV